MITSVIGQESLTAFVNGKMYVVPSTDGSFSELSELLSVRHEQMNEPRIMDLLDKPKMVERLCEGFVKVVNDTVTYKGQAVHGVLVDKLLDLLDDGQDPTPWAKFLNNLMDNPSYRSRQCLYNFLDHFQAPITTDGHFIAFKRVTKDFKDIYTQKMDNSVGSIVTMDRREVNEDPTQTCSAGLHVAASSYLDGYASADRAETIAVKVNPAHVVAVPKDYDFSKMRVCQYEVLAAVSVDKMHEVETQTVVTEWDAPETSASLDDFDTDWDAWDDEGPSYYYEDSYYSY